DLFGKDGFSFSGSYEPGDDRVMPIEWVEYEGYRISFKIYPEDWVDPEGAMMMPPRDPMYMLADGPYEPQWRVFANNEFTVTAPEGETLQSIEISLMPDCFKYGNVTTDAGTIVCNGGDTDVEASAKIPAVPYVWTCNNEEGYQSVTFTIGDKQFDGKSSQQFFFNCVGINTLKNSSVKITETSDRVTVYSINGTKMLENAPSDDVKSLNNGIYVVNGKTVSIRK
ncbi:MAG: hypothetical protein K2O47_03935, partial [Muribaculaceae bacterium]|nr:hypothetical protein [Muribaculaceae bacterium]